MKYRKINLVYFSATGTTSRIVSAIADATNIPERNNYNLLSCPDESISIPDDEFVIFGVPVFSGRIPAVSVERISRFTGNQTPAIIVCVYGNRDFEDALSELRDIVSANGFRIISAAAFIGQHSIFPKVANGRPDAKDLQIANEFGKKSIAYCLNKESKGEQMTLSIRGNKIYRAIKSIPLKPKTSKKCHACGICAQQCPSNAIDPDKPHKIDKDLCISCAHCIAVCPQNARYFGGLLYKFASGQFSKKYAQRQEPYIAEYV
ncbi:MAG: EFR1 family ferrodoxin [Bacteroidales bacterium]